MVECCSRGLRYGQCPGIIAAIFIRCLKVNWIVERNGVNISRNGRPVSLSAPLTGRKLRARARSDISGDCTGYPNLSVTVGS